MAMKIMVVDDSATARHQVAAALLAAGFEVVHAEHGDDALAKLETHADVRLVVSDINMPWKDGIELLTEIRASDTLKHLPVVMLTTEGNADRIQQARALGVTGYLTKPIKPELVVAAIRRVVG